MLSLNAVYSRKTDERVMTNLQEYFLSVPEGCLDQQISVKLPLHIRHRYTRVPVTLSRMINYQLNASAYSNNRVICANPMEPLEYRNMFPVASQPNDATPSSNSKELIMEDLRQLKIISSPGYHGR